MFKWARTIKQLQCENSNLKKKNKELHDEAQEWHNKYFLLCKKLRELCAGEKE